MGAKYQLRNAAGVYWLLNMEQEGLEYEKAVPMNEGGAYIWDRLSQKESLEEIARRMGQEYQLSETEALADIRKFTEQLKKQGIQW